MRRTTFGFAGLALLLAAGMTGLVVQGLAPAHRPAARPVSAPPAPPQSAALEAAVVPMPLFTPLVSPKHTDVAYFDVPNGKSVGTIPATTWGRATVRPVVKVQGRWLQVRLDSRPNGTTGWVPVWAMDVSTTPYRIVVSVGQRSLTLYQAGQAIYTAPVGVGRPQWPTPVGPSFVDAIVPVPRGEQYIYGPVLVVTGTHSDVFTDFDGGDGTVGIHAYPSNPASTNGVASSHGCIRASPQTMAAITKVPTGTPIDIEP